MKIDRLLGIVTTLLQKDKVTAAYLAEKFEVSRRTILRDLDDICRAGIPVVTIQGGGGGISIAEGYKLDKSVLTTGELQNIIAGLRGMESVDRQAGIERLIGKLSPDSDTVVSLRESVVIDLASNYKNSLSEKICLIKEAIASQRFIEFDYYYAKGQSRRRVEPYFIAFKWSSWYVFGYCTDRQDFRLFKLNRLWALTVTDDSFTRRDIPDDKLELGGSLTDENEATVLFDESVRYRLIEDFGLRDFHEMPDGKLAMTARYTNKDYIISWILSFGDKARVSSPPELAEELKQIAGQMIKNYN